MVFGTQARLEYKLLLAPGNPNPQRLSEEGWEYLEATGAFCDTDENSTWENPTRFCALTRGAGMPVDQFAPDLDIENDFYWYRVPDSLTLTVISRQFTIVFSKQYAWNKYRIIFAPPHPLSALLLLTPRPSHDTRHTCTELLNLVDIQTSSIKMHD